MSHKTDSQRLLGLTLAAQSAAGQEDWPTLHALLSSRQHLLDQITARPLNEAERADLQQAEFLGRDLAATLAFAVQKSKTEQAGQRRAHGQARSYRPSPNPAGYDLTG